MRINNLQIGLVITGCASFGVALTTMIKANPRVAVWLLLITLIVMMFVVVGTFWKSTKEMPTTKAPKSEPRIRLMFSGVGRFIMKCAQDFMMWLMPILSALWNSFTNKVKLSPNFWFGVGFLVIAVSVCGNAYTDGNNWKKYHFGVFLMFCSSLFFCNQYALWEDILEFIKKYRHWVGLTTSLGAIATIRLHGWHVSYFTYAVLIASSVYFFLKVCGLMEGAKETAKEASQKAVTGLKKSFGHNPGKWLLIIALSILTCYFFNFVGVGDSTLLTKEEGAKRTVIVFVAFLVIGVILFIEKLASKKEKKKE